MGTQFIGPTLGLHRNNISQRKMKTPLVFLLLMGIGLCVQAIEHELQKTNGDIEISGHENDHAVEARQWSWTRKCGGRSYNPTSHMCCNRRIQRKPRGYSPRCCGTRAYDAAYYMCCRGNIQFKSGLFSPRCCGTRAYDAWFYRCCNGRVKFNRC